MLKNDLLRKIDRSRRRLYKSSAERKERLREPRSLLCERRSPHLVRDRVSSSTHSLLFAVRPRRGMGRERPIPIHSPFVERQDGQPAAHSLP